MTTVAEMCKVEMLQRLQALPLDDYFGTQGIDAGMIRRSHLTAVDRAKAPAIYLRFGDATKSEDKSCNWVWVHEFRVSVYVRSDDDSDADPAVQAVVARLNPNATPYEHAKFVRIDKVEAETEVADADAQRVDVIGTMTYVTRAWNLEATP